MKLAIFGMFRSGTSYLWYCMSKDKRFKYSYYEPLHPHLLDDRKNHKHYAVYNDLEEIEKYHYYNLAFKKYILEPDDEYNDLRNYLNYLIRPNTLLKINRMPFRIKWFQKNFPEVKCVGILRDPRAFAYSHTRNGRVWDTIFFDLCLGDPKFNEYLEPLKNEPALTKLLAFWKLCAEEMIQSLHLVTIEHANKDLAGVIIDVYHSCELKIAMSTLDDILEPDDYTLFWGDSTKRYTEVA